MPRTTLPAAATAVSLVALLLGTLSLAAGDKPVGVRPPSTATTEHGPGYLNGSRRNAIANLVTPAPPTDARPARCRPTPAMSRTPATLQTCSAQS